MEICTKKLKHFQFFLYFLSLVHTGTLLPAKANNREDVGSEGREKATAERAQELEKVPRVLHLRNSRTFTYTHSSSSSLITS